MPIRALIRDGDRARWLAYHHPVAVLAAAHVDEVPLVIAEAEARTRAERLHAVGFLTYEAAAGLEPKLAVHARGVLPPAWFALFPEPRAVDPPGASFQAALPWQPSISAAAYRQNIARIRALIAAGDTYQVNFSYRLRTSLNQAVPDVAERLFAAMIRRQPAGFGAFVETDAWAICCASHELFFERRGRRLTSRPMKGTAPRGGDDREDARHADWLRGSLKNRAENLMITDMVRNDIGRLADVGSVRTEDLFRLEGHPTVWQMTSTVSGDSDAGLTDVFRALFPAASITGAPKRRTMEIIRELEPDPREIYTGAVGLIAPDGCSRFAVAIRTALVDKRRQSAEYGVGGGILWDSEPDQEHEETAIKARILRPDTPPDFSLLETLLWKPDTGFRLLPEHLRRLQTAARYFFWRSVDENRIAERLDSLAGELATARDGPLSHRVRLLVNARLDVQVSAAPLDPDSRPRRIALARTPATLAGNPFVTHKTTHREVYEAAHRETLSGSDLPIAISADDVLLINERGEVTESTIANLVVDLDGVLVTPPLSSGLLPGIYRQLLLDRGRVVERVVYPHDLHTARAIYLTNSVRGLWPVQLIDT